MRSTFVSEGLSNWKKAGERLQKHNESDAHKDSFMHVENLPKTVSDVTQWVAEGSFASKQNFSFFEHQQQTTKTSRTKRGK